MIFTYPSGEPVMEGDIVLAKREGRCVVHQLLDVNESEAIRVWAEYQEIEHSIILKTPLGGAVGSPAPTGVAHDLTLLARAAPQNTQA